MGKFIGFLQIIRPLNCIMMGFAVVVGASLVSNISFSSNILFGFVTSFALTAASMVTNDYYDRKIDAINEPNRPIPRGDITPKEALVFAGALSILGLITSYLTNLPSFALSIIAWIISLVYIIKGKSTGLPGNLLVSITVIIPFVYGNLVLGQLETSTLLFVTIVFLSNTGREITKGIVDIEGDRSHNIGTIAVKYGGRTAAIFASFFSLIAVFLSPLPWIWGLVSNLFLLPVLFTDIGLTVSALLLLHDYSRKNAKKIKNLSLAWFISGLLAFILGTL